MCQAYWSIWIAALLALPFSLLHQPTAYHRLVKAAILVMTSILFFYTRNFWLCWAVHAIAWLLLAQPTVASARLQEKADHHDYRQKESRRQCRDSADP